MSWHYTPYVLPLLLASAISAALALYAWRNRRVAPGATAFAVLMAATAEWSLGNACQLLGTDLATKLLWAKIQYPGVVTVPLAWLAFALQYTGRERWLTRRNLTLLAVVPVLTLLIIATTERHSLFWRDLRLIDAGPYFVMDVGRGPWFWVNMVFSYAALLAGTLLLLPRVLASATLYRWQAGSLLLGVAAPWLVNALFVFRLRATSLDPTPFALTLSGLAFAWGLFRYRLLDVGPIARDAVIEGMTDGMMVLDVRNRVVDLNPAAQRILARRASDAVGRTAGDVLGAWPELVEQFRHVFEGQAEISMPEGGGLRHYELRISPLAPSGGRPTGRLFVWRDITDRKASEAQLKGQKQLFENLLAVARATTERPTLEATLQNTLDVASSLTGAVGASLFLLDEAGCVTHSLIAQGRVPQIHRDEFIGSVMDKGLAGWVARHRQPALLPDTRSDGRWISLPGGAPDVRSALCVPISSGPVLVGILTLVHQSPGYFGGEHLAFIQAAADQMALAVRNAQIFDARSRMAERQTMLYEVLRAVGGQLDPQEVALQAVRAIAQRTPWPNVVVALPAEDGRNWTFQYVNRVAAKVSPMPIDKGIIGRAYATGRTQLVPDVTLDPDYVGVLPVIRSELAVPLRHGDRALGVLNLESEQPAAFGPDDAQLAESLADAVALALENARLYRALADEHERLLALERMKDDLTHTMVHDLRNPLTSVAGVLELLELTAAESLSANQLEMLKVARHGTQRMSDLVDAILDVSRLESGSMPLERERVALAPLVAEALKLQAPLAGDKRLCLENDVPAGQPTAWADPVLVGRVLQNLVGNAVKFTPHGGSVQVRVEVEASDPPMLRVAVSDTGPGVPDQVRGRLFQKFVTGGQKQEGSGLGLAFCRLAVEAHGGRIWVESAPGRGATFCFTLPVSEAAKAVGVGES